MSDLEACTKGLTSDPTFRLAQTVLSRTRMSAVLDQREILDADQMGEFRPSAERRNAGIPNWRRCFDLRLTAIF